MGTIHFIGGEKGGVGKSVVARLVAQYFIDKPLPFKAFDGDGSHGALLRFYKGYASRVDLTSYESVDQIMNEAMEDPQRRVLVDLPAQSERLVASWITEGDIPTLATQNNVPIVFWHVMDDGKDTLTTLQRLLQRYEGAWARFCLVKNHGRGKDFTLFDRSQLKTLAATREAAVIDLPELHPPAMQKIDRLDASFWAAVNGAPNGAESLNRMDRQRIKVWLNAAYDQLAKLGELL
jgi:hypothetical protein